MKYLLDDIKKITEKKNKVFTPVSSSKRTSVSSKIDLRGKMVEEAIYELESYMDRAMLTGYKEVQVVTGNGTGALEKEYVEYLKTCRYVKEFRFGGQGEGGVGCTVSNFEIKYTLIVAGGSGKRMGLNYPKQFISYKGRPIFVHVLEKLSIRIYNGS